MEATPNRGGCLTTFLILMFIANPVAGLYYLFAGSTVTQTVPNFPGWGIPLFVALSFANLVFAIGIWRWKRWGVYGFVVSAGVAFVVNLLASGILPALAGLLGLAILGFLLRDAWGQMA